MSESLNEIERETAETLVEASEPVAAESARGEAGSAVPEAEPIVGGLVGGLFGARGKLAQEQLSLDLGPWSPDLAGARGEEAPEYNGWKGASALADALCDLAFGRCASSDMALRLVARTVDSPIARRLLPECERLAERGVRVSILLSAEPRLPETIAPIAALSCALGVPRLDDFLRIADFPGADLCLEQAMVGDRLYWSGAPLARRRLTPLAEGSLFDLAAAKDAPDAARLRFAAAWRLGGEPSPELCRRVAAAARAL